MDLSKFLDKGSVTLYPKQREVIESAVERRFPLIMGEMGSGKTVISTYIAKVWLEADLVKKILVITKRETLLKYKKCLLDNIPSLNDSDIFVMDSNDDRNMFDHEAKVYICDYNQFKLVHYFYENELNGKKQRFVKKVLPIDETWGCFFDEIQAVKNTKSDTHKIVFANTKLAKAKVATSGTPIEKIEELYGVFRVLHEGILGINYHTFMNTIAVLDVGTYRILYYKKDGVEKIRKRLDPYITIINKSDIKVLPDKNIVDLSIDFTPYYRDYYLKSIEALRTQVNEEGFIVKKRVAHILQSVYNIIKMVSDLNPRFIKFDLLLKRLVLTEKVIVWERSPEIIENLSKYYTAKGISNLIIHGATNKDDRFKIIERFDKDPDVKVLFVSFLTTAEAWEIPSRPDCKRQIFYSLPDRVINYQQCMDRQHRLNSEVPIFIYRLILKESIDEWAVDLLEYKQKLKDGVISKKDFNNIEIDSYSKYLGIDKKEII